MSEHIPKSVLRRLVTIAAVLSAASPAAACPHCGFEIHANNAALTAAIVLPLYLIASGLIGRVWKPASRVGAVLAGVTLMLVFASAYFGVPGGETLARASGLGASVRTSLAGAWLDTLRILLIGGLPVLLLARSRGGRVEEALLLYLALLPACLWIAMGYQYQAYESLPTGREAMERAGQIASFANRAAPLLCLALAALFLGVPRAAPWGTTMLAAAAIWLGAVSRSTVVPSLVICFLVYVCGNVVASRHPRPPALTT